MLRPVNQHKSVPEQQKTRWLLDLLAAGKLCTDAVDGVTHMTENLHQTILGLGRRPDSKQKPNNPFSKYVYRSVRGINGLVAKGLQRQLSKHRDVSDDERSESMHAAISALNGVMGDRLADAASPLAIKMSFRYQGRTVQFNELSDLVAEAGGRVLLMIHGLCMNDLQWTRDGHNHGEALAREQGLVPLYLHYNTGLHISENGRQLSSQLEALCQALPMLSTIHILAHSMGGLISRSACFYAGDGGHAWFQNLKKLIFLGSPHHGAPLEKGGNWLGQLLNISAYSAPFLTLVNLRSAGITDLRHGSLCDEDWIDKHRFTLNALPPKIIPLPEQVACYMVAGNAGEKRWWLTDKLIGDGLVPLDSALGHHRDARRAISVPKHRQWVADNTHHLQLLSCSRLYSTLRQWFAQP